MEDKEYYNRLIKVVAGRLIAFLLGLTSASVLRGAFSRLNKREYI